MNNVSQELYHAIEQQEETKNFLLNKAMNEIERLTEENKLLNKNFNLLFYKAFDVIEADELFQKNVHYLAGLDFSFTELKKIVRKFETEFNIKVPMFHTTELELEKANKILEEDK
jgi:hypothetical protein